MLQKSCYNNYTKLLVSTGNVSKNRKKSYTSLESKVQRGCLWQKSCFCHQGSIVLSASLFYLVCTNIGSRALVIDKIRNSLSPLDKIVVIEDMVIMHPTME